MRPAWKYLNIYCRSKPISCGRSDSGSITMTEPCKISITYILNTIYAPRRTAWVQKRPSMCSEWKTVSKDKQTMKWNGASLHIGRLTCVDDNIYAKMRPVSLIIAIGIWIHTHTHINIYITVKAWTTCKVVKTRGCFNFVGMLRSTAVDCREY